MQKLAKGSGPRPEHHVDREALRQADMVLQDEHGLEVRCVGENPKALDVKGKLPGRRFR
ncbi:hypothetical protein [Mesorhizobium sp. NFR06]|uniref:hypothetical protein n=1 Tax=Mesorhizobium sp. NFR06 TaxID=1566290 RepID=UPI00165FA1FA|nr:hypothetical protein [Mesorhizobium sp. NFR06]